MPFRLLNSPPKEEEQAKPAGSTPTSDLPPMPVSVTPIQKPAGRCILDFEVDPQKKTYAITPHENCGEEIDALNALPLMRRRDVANHMKTDDPEYRKKLDEVKRRKNTI